MKRTRNPLYYLFFVLALLASLLLGACGDTATTPAITAGAAKTAASTAVSATTAASTKTTAAATTAVSTTAAAKTTAVITTAASGKATREVSDMEGRKVTIPAQVNRVLSLSNNTTVDVFTLAPDKLIGLSFALKDTAKDYIDAKYYKLPVVGTTSDNKVDYESILKLNPDLIICSDEDAAYAADDIQKQLNIPVVKVDTALDATDKVYTFLGDVLGEQAKAQQLAAYSRKTLDKVKTAVKAIPTAQQVKVYYAEGANWLQTDISGNVHTEVLDIAGGKNVADSAETKIGSMATVSMEQVLAWNPDVILVGATAVKGDFLSKVYSDAGWSGIKAVANKKIYSIPSLPFNWFDRPPSAIRVLGVAWLSNLLYPQAVKLDLKEEVKTFYATFYNLKLTDQQLQDILKGATAS